MRSLPLLLILSISLSIACGDSADEPIGLAENQHVNDAGTNTESDAASNTEDDSDTEIGPRDHMGPIGGDRPVTADFPDEYDVEGNHPLIIQLHGYGSNAVQTKAFFATPTEANERGVLTLTPEGTADAEGTQSWNLFPTGVDDKGYLISLIEEAVEQYAVDPDQVFLMGLSNGGFMSHLIACERGDLIRGIISFNGSSYFNAADCKAEDPVESIHVHATDDQTVPFNGAPGYYPAASTVVERWAAWNDCDPDPVDGPDINVTTTVDGDETSTEIWQNCTEGGAVQLWTINDAAHVPFPLADFAELVFDAIL